MNTFLDLLITIFPQRILAKVGFLNKTIQRKKSEKIQNEREIISSKFEGTLLGALIGDCVGKSLEGIWGPNLNEMLEDLRLAKEKCLDDIQLEVVKFYSDDTALTRSICESLISREQFEIDDIVNNFLMVYLQDPSRGYSSATLTLFKKLNILKTKNEIESRCLIPAMELFDGEGSYGSGGAMRCSPIALYTYLKPFEEMKLICELSTRITHTHKWSVIGALQQCFAIRLALQTNKINSPFDFDTYYNQILNFVYELELNFDTINEYRLENLEKYSEESQAKFLSYLEQKKIFLNENKFNRFNSQLVKNLPYTHLLLKLLKLIKKCRRGHRINMQNLYKCITSYNSTAIETIPLGLFSFMVASDAKCKNEVNSKLNTKQAFKQYNPVERVIFYAVSFGGEAQKVASMAGAIAGAFYSSDHIPKYLVDICESSEEIKNYATQLFDLCFKCEFQFELNEDVNMFKNNVNLDLVDTDDSS